MFRIPAVEVAPGAMLLRGFLAPDAQVALAAQCRSLIDGPVPGYVPIVRGGGHMHVRMLCLGRHWNGRTYSVRADSCGFRRARRAAPPR